jgi:hypothetical protein
MTFMVHLRMYMILYIRSGCKGRKAGRNDLAMAYRARYDTHNPPRDTVLSGAGRDDSAPVQHPSRLYEVVNDSEICTVSAEQLLLDVRFVPSPCVQPGGGQQLVNGGSVRVVRGDESTEEKRRAGGVPECAVGLAVPR